ncbi:hypothetical protein FJV83_23575 [Mesorhizobium sp. WSM4307]|nr:hypothetical protein FJV81_35965 [Mesorhizobium sp. WSM4315]TRC82589.1 hypothetical protein FJV83_23575 [Mesorhizobium sp. WSM4307]
MRAAEQAVARVKRPRHFVLTQFPRESATRFSRENRSHISWNCSSRPAPRRPGARFRRRKNSAGR